LIYIIIPVHNRVKLTIDCLDSLKKQTYKNYTIIVVDDGSNDDTSKKIIEKFGSSIKILKGNGNLWWAGATNLGIKYIINRAKDNDFILTLNNDLILKENYLASLIDCYNRHPNCMIGSLTLYKGTFNKINYGGSKWNRITAKHINNFKDGEIINLDVLPDAIDTDVLPGRGTLIPIYIFKKIGFYDNNNFPQYAADYDFSLRAKESGYNLIISTDSLVFSEVKETGINFKYSKPSFSTFIKSLHSIRSANNLKIRIRFAKKHTKFWVLYIIFDVFRLMGSFFRSIIKYYYRRARIILIKINLKNKKN
jgi:GT2 family glycosyltransferase